MKPMKGPGAVKKPAKPGMPYPKGFGAKTKPKK